jgi:hypothetical protein
MDDKVSKLPMIALIAASAIGVLAFSIGQYSEKKTAQETSVNELRAEHIATEAVMKKIGQDSIAETERRNEAAQRAYISSPQYQEAKRLEAEDREWLKTHPK